MGPSVEQERAELKSVVSSERFARSPQLIRLLDYLCSKYFAGQADQIKEYNIATEVLGRPVKFDPSQDAIARVEAYRLRKKLQEYYAEEGAGHEIRIVLSRGKYVPMFQHVRRPLSAHTAPESEPAELGSAEPPSSPEFSAVQLAETTDLKAQRWQRWRPYMVAGVCFVVAGAAVWAAISRERAVTVRVSAEAHRAAIADPNGSVVRILAGCTAGTHIDSDGSTWDCDRYYSGGTSIAYTEPFIARTNDQLMFQKARSGEFSYDIPLKPGTYELHLFFAELAYGPAIAAGGGESSRTFVVKANGQTLLERFDVFADADGPNIADERVFRDIHPAADGRLHLQFFRDLGDPILNGFEILPGVPGRQLPVRVVTQNKPVTDSQGQVWNPDTFYSGGRQFGHQDSVRAGTEDAELYSRERFGHFDYAIPVDTRDRYSVTLHFVEAFWGSPSDNTRAGVGSRVFNVNCNGVRLLSNLDIFKEAGSLHPLTKSFHGLRPNAQGKLVLSFEPVVNYASLSALAVEDDSP